MSQEVLIYNPFSHFYFELEVNLEIVNDHINRGDHVTFLTCDADLPSCEPNPSHNLDFCRNQCILNGRYQGFEVTGLFGKVDFRNFVLLSKSDRERIENFPKEVKTLKRLKSLMIDNFDVGMAVASSLIDFTKEPYPNPQHYQSYIRANIVAGLTVYLSMLN